MRKIVLSVGSVVFAALMTLGTAIPAGAEPASGAGPSKDVVVVFSEDHFQAARAESRRRDKQGIAKDATVAGEQTSFIAEGKARGVTYRPEDLDIVNLGKIGTKDVLVTVPRDTAIKQVTIHRTRTIDEAAGTQAWSYRVEVDAEPESLGVSPAVASQEGPVTISGGIDCPISSVSGLWKLTVLSVGYFYANW